MRPIKSTNEHSNGVHTESSPWGRHGDDEVDCLPASKTAAFDLKWVLFLQQRHIDANCSTLIVELVARRPNVRIAHLQSLFDLWRQIFMLTMILWTDWIGGQDRSQVAESSFSVLHIELSIWHIRFESPPLLEGFMICENCPVAFMRDICWITDP
jgi:hypothetical protein